MPARRALLAGVAAAVAGCVGPGGSDPAGGPDDDGTATERRRGGDTPEGDATSGSHLRASPVGAPDREPVLSSDDEAIARIEPLVDLVAEAADTLETTYAPLSPEDTEAFEAATADVERYDAGNPPGYYIDHRGLVVSVARSG